MGWFRPALFFTQSLWSELTPGEFEAIILHEVSHLALHHVRKRLWGGFFVFVLTVLIFIPLMMVTFLFFRNASAVPILLGALGYLGTQIYWMRRLVRRQEIEADENAIRLGADSEVMVSALTKLTLLNDQLVNRKSPSSFLNVGSAHPTTEERISILRTRRRLAA